MPGRVQSEETRPRALGVLTGLLVLLLLALLLSAAAPGAARPYTGPGQTGTVPVGEDGLAVSSFAGVVDDHLFVALDGIPSGTCRIVLDENGTYAGTQVHWSEGDPEAYVSAAAGKRDAPFRVHAVWRLDINDNCTVEETEEKTYWHDPRGRPFVDLRVLEELPIFAVAAGNTTHINLTVHNNGTIADTVSAEVVQAGNDFPVRTVTPTLDVSVGPMETVVFGYKVTVPRDALERTNTFVVQFESDSGWSKAHTSWIQVGPPHGDDPDDDAGEVDPATLEPLEPPGLESRAVPVSGLSLLAPVLAFWIGRARRRL